MGWKDAWKESNPVEVNWTGVPKLDLEIITHWACEQVSGGMPVFNVVQSGNGVCIWANRYQRYESTQVFVEVMYDKPTRSPRLNTVIQSFAAGSERVVQMTAQPGIKDADLAISALYRESLKAID